MARSTLADLIARVRLETGASSDLFSDDEVQTFLDAIRQDLFDSQLAAVLDAASDTYTSFGSSYSCWEDDYILHMSDGTVVTPTLDDDPNPLVGVWGFNPGLDDSHLFIDGKTYDVHLAAADLLEAWAATVALDFDFKADQQSFARSQKREALLELAAVQKQKTRPRAARLVRTDEDERTLTWWQ